MKQVYKSPVVPSEKEWKAMSKRMAVALGVPENYSEEKGLAFHSEASELVLVMIDYQGKALRLEPETAKAWLELEKAAKEDGVELLPYSGFRSYKYQLDLIRAILKKGDSIDSILTRLAAPGFSEHHSGRALDITDTKTEPVSQEFENTEAYKWLEKNALRFSFELSYPKDNKFGIIYEPWHWAYRGKK